MYILKFKIKYETIRANTKRNQAIAEPLGITTVNAGGNLSHYDHQPHSP
jgi:hypothetical protein